MKKWQYKSGNVSLIYLMRKANKTKSDLGRLLNVSNVTIHSYLCNPYLMTLNQLYTISAVLNINTLEMIHLIVENTPQNKDSDVWYQRIQNSTKQMNKLIHSES